MELKSGETINGVLTEIDNLMNLTLTEVIETSAVCMNAPSFKVSNTNIPPLEW